MSEAEEINIGDKITITAKIQPGEPVVLNAKIKKAFRKDYFQIEYENSGKKHLGNRFLRDIKSGWSEESVNAKKQKG